MKEYVLDANALVRLIRNTAGADTVAKLVIKAKAGQARLFISVVNLAEVLYVLSRYFSQGQSIQYIESVRSVVAAIPIDLETALEAAALRIRYKLGLTDCFAAQLAMSTGATLVTADSEFDRFGKSLKFLSLPRRGK